MPKHERLLEALSQVVKPPFHLITSEIGLVVATALFPTERPSENNPAGWEERNERWQIDDFLGKYKHEKREIIIPLMHLAPVARVVHQMLRLRLE